MGTTLGGMVVSGTRYGVTPENIAYFPSERGQLYQNGTPEHHGEHETKRNTGQSPGGVVLGNGSD